MNIFGARWWKVDFHVHTPASNCYKSEERSTTPREFLLNAMRKNIDCLVISDHETAEWIDPLKSEYEMLKNESPQEPDFKEIFLFPAFEFGQAIPAAHLLCIFDIDYTSSQVQTIVGSLTGKTFPECIKLVSEKGGVAIPAHVQNPNKGIFSWFENDGTLSNQLVYNYLQKNLYAIECDDSNVALPQILIDNKIHLSKIVGSDSHDLESIGSKYTWVKMQSPNIEALRLALFDEEDGTIHFDKSVQNPNAMDNKRYIKSISISNAVRAGNGSALTINFSPWLNTIIGGRGTGKSAVLNFLRIGLAEHNGLDDLTKKEFDRFNKKPENRKSPDGMLKDSTVIEVVVCEENIDYRLRYSYGDNVTEEVYTNGNWQQISEGLTNNENHPVAIFNQKQVYNMALSQDAVMNIIDNMSGIKSIKKQISENIELYLEVARQIKTLENQIEKGKEYERTILVNGAKLEAYKDSPIKNLMEKYDAAIEFQQRIENVTTKLSERVEGLNNIKTSQIDIETVTAVIESNNKLDNDLKESKEQIIAFLNVIKNHENKLNDDYDLFITQIAEWESELSQLPFNNIFTSIKSAYDEEYQKLLEQGIKVENIEEILKENQDAFTELEKINEKRVQLEEFERIKASKYDEITSLIKSIISVRKDKIRVLNQNNEFLRIDYHEYANAEDSEEEFRTAINKNDSTFKEEIYSQDDNGERGILFDICSKESSEEILETRNQFVENVLNYCLRDEEFNCNGRLKAHFKRVFDAEPDLLEKFVFWYPKDNLELTLITDGNETPVSSGSAGQRVAGMLAFLLAINDKPIIIDQPEEDLDTKLISEFIVEEFKKIKTNQQLIVITHNPNIPVNAAAENIISMNFTRGQIQVRNSGALQLENIRKDICTVMEGGKKALDNRYFRVSKALKN